MADHSRVYDGFADLSRGMDGGRSPTLILPNQVAEAINVTFRGAFVKTRPPVWRNPLTYVDAATRARFTGKFQGALFYRGKPSCHIISKGGRLFRIEIDTNLVSEITPRLSIVVTQDFTVPAIAGTVNAMVTSETVFTVGQNIIIDSGSYTITNRFANELELTYNGGAANATVSAGAAVQDSLGIQIFEVRENPSSLDFVYLFQAENYAIVLAGQQRTVIYDGASSRLSLITGEVPPGVLGIYIWGRIWIVLPDSKSFVAGDLVHTTTQADYSDILKFTENDFFNEGGTFGVPSGAGEITAMQALATQDTSLGQGNLLVGADSSVFSVNTPVDRAVWKNLTWPIQTVSLIDYGPVGPRCGPTINGDWWYRALDGIRSFIVARREIQVWGNTPMSRELEPLLDPDSDNLLFFASGILFDNRLMMTVSPYHTTNLGVAHRGLAVMNFDLLSSLGNKTTPAWEGAWSGFPILQLTKGIVGKNKERAFAFVANEDCLEIWEFKKAKDGYYDQVTSLSEDGPVITRIPIESRIDSRAMSFESPNNLKKLRMGELYIDEIVDNVTLTVRFRPDQYPNWIDWATISFCANVTQCTVQAPEDSECEVWKPRAKQYAARVRLPLPDEACNDIAGIPVDRGFEFQFQLEWTGHCRVRKFRAHANFLSMEMEGACPSEVECKTIESCGSSWFDYDALPMCS
jgi:hypothetical protein